jgi:squalene-associated FAD-dependent desaturase
MAPGTVHIIGAGLSGLSAAVRLTEVGRRVVVHELARFAGGRCRSFVEPSLGIAIDNGNHLVLSGNHAALAHLRTVGAEHMLLGPEHAEFPFADLSTGARWTLRPNDGPLPWWIFSKARRVPGTSPSAYLALARLLTARRDETIGEVVTCSGPLYDKLLRPVLLSALNIDPPDASAALAGQVVRETLARGGRATRPLVAAEGLGPVFIDSSLAWLERQGVAVRFNRPLRKLEFAANHVTALQFADERIALGTDDTVVLAVPAWAARTLVPGLTAPQRFTAILNGHFAVTPPPGQPRILGVVNATTEWLFAFPNRLSVTVSGADRFNESEREPLARTIWAEVAALTGLDAANLPPWVLIKERRATFAATPEENARRPGAVTAWRNLLLAGDWTATGLPSTIEGSIRSGVTAAAILSQRGDRS